MEKACFKCGVVKPLSDFYKHAQMKDGHLNKCKECTKSDSLADYNRLSTDPIWIEKEKERNREKYRRLNYRDSKKPSYESKKEAIKRHFDKYPEKRFAKNVTTELVHTFDGSTFHHWSYNKEHYKDVIELIFKDHKKAHRFIIYDQEQMMYRTLDGILLDTKERHLEYILDKIKNEKD